jgi:threonine/homoserine/homoserine lactone efflux protein
VGAIGVLVIRRTLAHGRLHGFFSGMGAATADAIYGAIAALGLTALTSFLTSTSDVIRFFGGLFLLYVGYKTLISKPQELSDSTTINNKESLLSAYFTVLMLTLTNPMTIISFIGIFAGLGANTDNDPLSAFITVLGVFLGSAAWWLVLSFGVGLVRERFTPRWMLWVNRLSGIIIIVFALIILRDLLLHVFTP